MATKYEEMSVDELRAEARRHEVSGASSMRKDELVAALEGLSGGSRGGSSNDRERPRKDADSDDGTSKSIKYSQRVDSPDEHEERPGRSLYTQDHDVIRQWAEARDGVPATVEGTEHEDHLGVLRFDFGGDSEGSSRLRHVSWDEWFKTFDDRGLRFIYQEHRSDGSDSNFFRLENPNREDG